MSEPIYADPLVQISLAEPPCVVGDILLSPVKKVEKIFDLDEKEIIHLFFSSSYAATALFELLGAQGTNILLTELPGKKLEAEIIARKEGDGLNLMWEPTQMDQTELKDVAKKIKDEVDQTLWREEHPNEVPKNGKVESKPSEVVKEEVGKVNYLLKSLIRKP